MPSVLREQGVIIPENVVQYFTEREGFRNTVLLFQGQGTQEVGMGQGLFERYPQVRSLYHRAERILGFSLLDLTEEQLKQTYFTQLGIFVHSEACRIALTNQRKDIHPRFYAGSSLGQFNALYAAGAFSFENGLRLVQARAFGMQLAGDLAPGGLCAVLIKPDDKGRLTEKQREVFTSARKQLINNQTGLFLEADNSEIQFIVAGRNEDLETQQKLLAQWISDNKLGEMGIRITRLNVAGAFHSPLMRPAEPFVNSMLKKIHIQRTHLPVIANTTAKPITEPEEIRQEIIDHLTMPVLWRQTMNYLEEQGVAGVLEIGKKPILAGMMRNRGTVVGLAATGAALVGIAAFLLLRRPPEEKKN